MTHPAFSSTARRRNGAHSTALNYARKRAVKALNVADGLPEWTSTIEQHVCDLSKRETIERARIATDGVWRAYVNSAELRRAAEWRRFQEDPEAEAAMVRIEERLSRELGGVA